MANKRSRSRKSSNSRTKSRRRKQYGGNTGGTAPPSAWGHAMNTVGDGLKQFQDSLIRQPGQNLVSNQSNDLVPIVKPNMSGGKRHRRKSAKGGSWEAVAAQALVPGFLLGAQQLYGRRLKSRKHQ
jgi:hypothetical protein